MLSVRATYDGRQLKLAKKLDIKKTQQVIVIFLDYPEQEDDEKEPFTAKELHPLLVDNPALDFLKSKEEDMYTDLDLKVKY